MEKGIEEIKSPDPIREINAKTSVRVGINRSLVCVFAWFAIINISLLRSVRLLIFSYRDEKIIEELQDQLTAGFWL